MSAQPDTCIPPAHGWTCFHCGETFTTQGGAAFHFGADPGATPGCMIKVAVGDERGWLIEIRKLEKERDELLGDLHNETSASRVHHESLAAELKTLKPFANCSTLRDVFNVWDSMEGRALAAEERAANIVSTLQRELALAQRRAWDSLGKYKFLMFGYWVAIWVHLNRIGDFKHPNPWRHLVHRAREVLAA